MGHERTRTRCSATLRSGRPCRSWAVHGASVCNQHGGAAPQVRAAAQERLDRLANDAVGVLRDIMNNPTLDPAVKIKAAAEVLNRHGNLEGIKRSERDVNVSGRVSVEHTAALQPGGEIYESIQAERRRRQLEHVAAGGHLAPYDALGQPTVVHPEVIEAEVVE